MVLSDGSIRRRLESGSLKIEGMVDPDRQIQPASVDLCLGRQIRRFREQVHCDPARTDPNRVTESRRLDEREMLYLGPGEFLLATTVEWVELPADLVGHLSGLSSLGRLGLFIENAGVVDPGFRGELTLELYNASPQMLTLYPGRRICQLEFMLLDAPAERPYGHPDRKSKYQGQQGATLSRVWEEYYDPDGPITMGADLVP